MYWKYFCLKNISCREQKYILRIPKIFLAANTKQRQNIFLATRKNISCGYRKYLLTLYSRQLSEDLALGWLAADELGHPVVRGGGVLCVLLGAREHRQVRLRLRGDEVISKLAKSVALNIALLSVNLQPDTSFILSSNT